MKTDDRMTDRLLDARLNALREEAAETAALRPPVINPFRLEAEKARRAERRQAAWLARAAFLSVLLTTLLLAAAVWVYSPQWLPLVQSPGARHLWHYVRAGATLYRQPIACLLWGQLLFLLMIYAVSGLLLRAKGGRKGVC